MASDFEETIRAFAEKSSILTGSSDQRAILWNLQGQQFGTRISVDSTDWIVTTPTGLFDASPGAMKLMHFVVGLEVIELEQLKERYYEPGLLAKIMGYQEGDIRDVEVFDQVKLYPEIQAEITNHQLIWMPILFHKWAHATN